MIVHATWRDELGLMVSSHVRLQIDAVVVEFNDEQCVETMKLAHRAALLEQLEEFVKQERAKDATR